ncbi:L-lactate dehydrogenase A chain [Fasciola hepatica]|uniref:L-lactate dehydrogenase n=1 Tax=Fasciola hepatica TaxID=6192 RepID=A0A2H1C729_FASHE|nr:L-lactate dehydrogenase A chain [Fasciola hepatica]
MSSILIPVAPAELKGKPRTKVTVVGVGSVGMASAFSLMEVVGELALIDVAADKVRGEVLDLQHGQQFLRRCTVRGGPDYKESENSDIVVITAGARQNEGESRLNLVQRNVEIFKKIIPEIVRYSPNCIIVVVSNPVDILTNVAAKLSGFPRHRVLGTGTMLDSARFRYLLGQRLGVSANSVHGYVIGEHGDSSVPIWSNVNVAGVRLSSVNKDIGTERDPQNYEEIHKEVVNSAYEIIKLKGYTSWAIGLTVRSICNSILNDLHTVYPLSICAKGIHGITEDIYLSLPCLTTSVGVSHVIPQQLNEQELQQIQNSARTLAEVLEEIKL